MRWLFAVVVSLLVFMVAVPPWAGARREALRQQVDEGLFPARAALLEIEDAFASVAANARSLTETGDTIFLDPLRLDVARARAGCARMERIASTLGPEITISVRELAGRCDEMAGMADKLTSGGTAPVDRAVTAAADRRRLEEALESAAAVETVLERMAESTRSQVSASERQETLLVGGLGLAAAVVSIIVGLLMRRTEVASRRLVESESRFRQIAESLREAIWIADTEYTRYYYINPAQERLWGRSMENALDNARSLLDVVHPDDRARVAASLEKYALGEVHLQYRILRPDGEVRWIAASGYPVQDRRGRTIRVAGIAEDITERKREAEERERLLEREKSTRQKLESALRVRDQVLRIVSHDLKNPLHTIGMAVDLLGLPEPSGERRAEQVDIIRRAVDRASRMTHNLLDALRIEAGHAIPIQPAPVEVRSLLNDTAEMFRLDAAEKQQRLTCQVADGVGSVLADYDRIVEALSNLLGNAVKFTPEGGRIQVSARRDGDAVEIAVSDTGPGIQPDLLPTLFAPFAQAKDTASLGTGLGLAITAEIVKAHGGELNVETRPGEGTTFRFSLPAARSA